MVMVHIGLTWYTLINVDAPPKRDPKGSTRTKKGITQKATETEANNTNKCLAKYHRRKIVLHIPINMTV